MHVTSSHELLLRRKNYPAIAIRIHRIESNLWITVSRGNQSRSRFSVSGFNRQQFTGESRRFSGKRSLSILFSGKISRPSSGRCVLMSEQDVRLFVRSRVSVCLFRHFLNLPRSVYRLIGTNGRCHHVVASEEALAKQARQAFHEYPPVQRIFFA